MAIVESGTIKPQPLLIDYGESIPWKSMVHEIPNNRSPEEQLTMIAFQVAGAIASAYYPDNYQEEMMKLIQNLTNTKVFADKK